MMVDRSPALCYQLQPAPDAEAVWLALADKPYCLFLDSALRDERLGRYSFVAADPFQVIQFQPADDIPLDKLRSSLARWMTPRLEGLPPFQGGLAGLFSYDFARSLERLPTPQFDEFQVPAVVAGFYDVVVAFDHLEQRAWIISQGLPEPDPAARRRRAEQRLEQFRGWIAGHPSRPQLWEPPARAGAIAPSDLAPQYAVGPLPGLTSTFSAETYRHAVQQAIEYIYAGDLFQVNLAQRLLYPAREDPLALYQRLRRRNPAPFGGFFQSGQCQILSASPERFLSLRNGQVEARPIKGTRQRTAHPEADLFAGDELRESEKDRAENVMIVDLLRNDLSRVCLPESVQVTQLCRLEIYQYVQHLVSAIRGELAPGKSALDLLEAAFPGGSITGAPKVRAMQIIAELEPTARGAYCGSLGYIGFDGSMDLSILIRTITASRGWWQMPVGGGIVAQSQPQPEYEETWHKAAGLLRALTED